uniref:Protein NYNRIN-like n=1 Tax=Nicotiana sylvestris TaxID=4096 RepID=A0A1U7XHN2_NICSY|nr:PREDICTED: protein NYNRIN-like [Nicotiana sylvestris]
MKAQALADHLAENHVDDEYQPLSTYFPDEEVNSVEVNGDLIHAPPSELHPISAPWPFVAWDMNVIWPIEPKASNGHRFLLVAIDYFTKWVEAVTLKSITKKVVVDFLHSNIICRFGITTTIITNNAANLNSHLMREIYE